MKMGSWLLGGFIATLVLDVLFSAAQALGLTRLSLPYVLGTMVTKSRDRAKLYGFGLHLIFGWAAALIYVAAFHQLGRAGWWRGALGGLLHAAVVLFVLLPALPGLHPRMASERHGPEAEKQLEPPGKIGLHYGLSTPAAIVLGHAIYGAILGAIYRTI